MPIDVMLLRLKAVRLITTGLLITEVLWFWSTRKPLDESQYQR